MAAELCQMLQTALTPPADPILLLSLQRVNQQSHYSQDLDTGIINSSVNSTA